MTTLDPVDLLADLVRIDSANPGLSPDGPGEGAIADFVIGWLTDQGFACERLEDTPGRPSVVAVHRGSGGGRSLMLNGHLDTVTLASYEGDALDPVVRDGRMYGRGTYDMLAGIAAMMVAAADVASGPHAGDIVLALVADEEFASAGTEEVLRHGVRTDAAIICEPTEEELVIAHRGFAWFDVTVHGRAAHGSRRDLGIDAITKAGAFLVALGAHDAELAARPAHPLLGTGSVHASIIHGGEEQSSYPASCTISLERRTLPGEDAASVGAELTAILDAIAGSDPEFRYTLAEGLSRAAHAVSDQTPIARAVDTAHLYVTGAPVMRRGEPFWTDAALLSAAGIPAVLYGPRGGGAHAAAEWVELDSLHRVRDVLRRTVRAFVGGSELAR